MRRIQRLWKQFRAWPEILQLMLVIAMAICALLALPRSAHAQPTGAVYAICKDGKLVGVRIIVPVPGMFVLAVPLPNPCGEEEPAKRAPEPEPAAQPQKTAVA